MNNNSENNDKDSSDDYDDVGVTEGLSLGFAQHSPYCTVNCVKYAHSFMWLRCSRVQIICNISYQVLIMYKCAMKRVGTAQVFILSELTLHLV